MLFQSRFHEGIRRGEITATYRPWDQARATAGKAHRCGRLGRIEVLSVDEVPLSSLDDSAAKEAGFETGEELRAYVKEKSKRPLEASSTIYRVRFRYLEDEEDPREALRQDTSKAAVVRTAEKLASIDRRSRRGPWTRAVLELVAAHPETLAGTLAKRLGRQRLSFKADVRKLKELGLTISHEIGYSLSPHGLAALKELRRRQ
ncbi:MAG: hypothetical protein RL885_06080 [Planctomycetota bacterium]